MVLFLTADICPVVEYPKHSSVSCSLISVNMATSLQDETLMVANDYMDFCVGIKKTPPSESAKAMRYMAKEVEDMYSLELQRLMQSFLINCPVMTWTELRNVMLGIVDHEDLRWSHIVVLFAFTGVLAVKMSTIDEDFTCCRRLAEMITDVLRERQEWMIQNGGWVCACNFVIKNCSFYVVSCIYFFPWLSLPVLDSKWSYHQSTPRIWNLGEHVLSILLSVSVVFQ